MAYKRKKLENMDNLFTNGKDRCNYSEGWKVPYGWEPYQTRVFIFCRGVGSSSERLPRKQ